MEWDRRDVLKMGTGALAAGTLIGCSSAQASKKQGHQGHAAHGASGAQPALSGAVSACIQAGEICIDHCLKLLAQGDTSMSPCAESVQTMLAVCRAMGSVAPTGSKHTRALAQLCATVCADCEVECRKHEDKHAACKACAEACKKTADAARAV